MFRSLRNRLTVIFIGLAILPLLIVSIILTQGTFNTLEDEALNSQQAIAERVGTEIRSIVERREDELRSLVNARGLSTLDADEQRLLLSSLLSYQPAYLELALLDASGQEQIRVSRYEVISADDLQDRGADPAFQAASNQETIYYSPVRFDETVREPLVTIALPIPNLQTGEMQGVLVADVRFKPIWDLIAETDLRGEELIYVIDDQGQVVAHGNPSVVLRGTQIDIPEDDGRAMGLLNEEVLLASEPLQFGDQRFRVVAERPTEAALAQAWEGVYAAAGVTAIALALAIGMVIMVVHQFVRPIESLSTVARTIQDGDLSRRAVVNSQDEIGTLANAFNDMTEQLADSIDNLEARVDSRTRDLRVAADVSRQVTTVLDLEVLLPQLVASTRTGFDLYHVSVFLYNPDTHKLTMEAGIGRHGHIYRAREVSFDFDQPRGVVPLTARQREPVLVNDVQGDTPYVPDTALPHTRSELAIPMVIGTKLIGVLDLQSDQPNHFKDEDVWVMTSLAEQLAVAIQNARLYVEQVKTADKLREMDHMKSQFLASMSHELRTPLNAILNFTQFVVSGVLGDINERQLDALSKTITSGEHLLSLINDILDISKIEAGKLELFVEEVNLDKEVQTVVDTAQSLLAKKPDVALNLEVDEALPAIMGDRRRIRQILLNLVSNATKFTEQGSITIRATSENGTVKFAVQDTGPGIDPDDYDIIFDSFRQEKGGLRSGEGTGLGLPISKQLVEAHEGKLWLESEVGQGTTFYISLPVYSEKVAAMMEV